MKQLLLDVINFVTMYKNNGYPTNSKVGTLNFDKKKKNTSRKYSIIILLARSSRYTYILHTY